MKHKDFKVGGSFFTASGQWKCVDKGAKTVIAFKITPKALKEPAWDVQDNIIFYQYDWGGCSVIDRFVKPTMAQKQVQKTIVKDHRDVSNSKVQKLKKKFQKEVKEHARSMKSVKYTCGSCHQPKKDTGIWVLKGRNRVKACQKCSVSLPRAKS